MTRVFLLLLLAGGSVLGTPAHAQQAPTTPPPSAPAQEAPSDPGAAPSPLLAPLPTLNFGKPAAGEEDYVLPIQLLLLMTVLSLAPAIALLMTCFTRLVVIFSILRQALGTQQAPPNQVLIGLAMFLSVFIMHPVLSQINETALQPYLRDQITQQQALDLAAAPMKQFMLAQTREKDLMLFMDMAGITAFDRAENVPLHVLVPAYVISELRIAFQIGFMIFLPFLVVDLIVASVLMSMGMMMLPPMMISLPVKLLLFVLSDGWYLLVESLVRSYTG